ncbi:nitroreductase [Sneathiella marina]|uniref:Putative NAD(P)H nitroreductase n=1 Tax=Sneathiella marina TaxID=2950108 RepID=A0ABY4W640_9PROT|nr:nitroreductase [Sneathiella marina]USG62326.1 nitroreductase [Sneathiella marina]
MEAIDALLSRKSSAMLDIPAPSPDEIQILLQAATRAPDHCRLRPWKFLIIENDARKALGDVMVEALRIRDPKASDAMLEKTRGKPLRAPLIIVVIAKVEEHPKVPNVEQVLSAGAAAQNIMIAAHALGYAGIWRSGAPCFDEHVREALGATGNDQIVGFLYLGTASKKPILPNEPIDEYLEFWTGKDRN